MKKLATLFPIFFLKLGTLLKIVSGILEILTDFLKINKHSCFFVDFFYAQSV